MKLSVTLKLQELPHFSEPVPGTFRQHHSCTSPGPLTVRVFHSWRAEAQVPARRLGLPRIGSEYVGAVKAQNRIFPNDLGGSCAIRSLIIDGLRQGVSDTRPVLVLRIPARSTKPAHESNASHPNIRFPVLAGLRFIIYIQYCLLCIKRQEYKYIQSRSHGLHGCMANAERF